MHFLRNVICLSCWSGCELLINHSGAIAEWDLSLPFTDLLEILIRMVLQGIKLQDISARAELLQLILLPLTGALGLLTKRGWDMGPGPRNT